MMNAMNSIKLHTSQETAQQELLELTNEGKAVRSITARFKNPARVATLNIPAAAWTAIESEPMNANYRSILMAVLDSAAKSLISKQLSAFSVWPSSIDAGTFAPAALLDEATGANSDWMTKEEIEQAWRDSATRAKWAKSPSYASNPAFRRAVTHYEQLVCKMAGKTTSYTPEDLDLILAKMDAADLATELGSFVTRRIEAIKNKPQRIEVIDTNLL